MDAQGRHRIVGNGDPGYDAAVMISDGNLAPIQIDIAGSKVAGRVCREGGCLVQVAQQFGRFALYPPH